MRLGTAVAFGVVGVIVSVLLATIAAVAVVVDRAARTDVAQRVDRSRDVFRALHADRQARYQSEARVIAEEPRLKASVATEDPHLPTISGVAESMKKTARSRLFLLVDAEGALLVDADRPSDPGGNALGDRPVVARALEEGDAGGVWADAGGAYLVHAQRIAFGDSVFGAVIVGYAVNDEIARGAFQHTGSPIVILLDGAVLAAAGFPPEVDRAWLPDAVARVEPDGRQSRIKVAGTEYMAAAAAFPDYEGERDLRYVVLANLDEALAPGRKVSRILLLILSAGIAAAVVIAFVLSRRLSRPLAQLVKFTRVVASGDLAARASAGGPTEVRELEAAMNRMVGELDESRGQLAEKHRLENELEIAAQIQTSILPDRFDLPGLDIAARMEPASEVGGDYYDAFAVDGGGWIGIGDVAGHGLSSGLVMLMAQTSVATLVEALPEASPRGMLMAVNRVIYDNVHRRMRRDRHMTMSLIRYFATGKLVVAGAHLDIAVVRARDGSVEEFPTTGTWLGLTEEIGAVTHETEIDLSRGDTVVLYTDGVTEAESEGGEMYGTERLYRTLGGLASSSARAMLDGVFDEIQAWQVERKDDISLVVMRFEGVS